MHPSRIACTLALGAVTLFACKQPHQEPAPLLENRRQITFTGQRAGEGYFTADDQQLVFQSEREPDNPFYQIYRLDLHTGETQRVSTGLGKTTCAWPHPTQGDTLFASTHHDPLARQKQVEELARRAQGTQSRYAWDYDPEYELYQASPTREAPQRLTYAQGYDAEGSWSHDGKLIVFASNRRAYEKPLSKEEREHLERDPSFFIDIFVMNADGSDVRQLTDSPGYDGGPFFSPDGRRIVWRRFTPDGAQAEIWTMNADGSDPKPITKLGHMSWAPFYHPSGDYLIFTTNLHGFDNFELYIVDAEGKRAPVRVTDDPGFDGLPVFSNDGQVLAWSKAPPGERNAQIVMADWNDAAARAKLGLQARESRPRRVPNPQANAFASPERLREFVSALTSAAYEGRMTGTPGAQQAAGYVAQTMAELGLVPLKGHPNLLHPFTFRAGVSLGEDNTLTLTAPKEAVYTVDRDWRPLAFSASGPVAPSGITFAGYGIVAPAQDGMGEVDAYAHLDITDRWVMVLRQVPQEIPEAQANHQRRYALVRHKAMVARERGARGLIVVSGPRSSVRSELVPLASDASSSGSSLPVISVTNEVAQGWLELAGRSLETLQAQLDRGEAVMGFELQNLTLAATIDVQVQEKVGHNVVGMLPSPVAHAPPLVLGAHLDGLGRGDTTGSLARDEEKGSIHPGADDNASGVAALLEMARMLRQIPPKDLKRNVIFAAWGGEELGLLGSADFARSLHDDANAKLTTRVAAYLNLDMVGRLREALVLQGVSSSNEWPRLIETIAVQSPAPLRLQSDPYLPTDATTFFLRDVPVLNAFTGAHPEYHTPRDTADRLNYAGLGHAADVMGRIAIELAKRPTSVAFEPAKGPPPQKGRGFRVYLGTIPDYAAADVRGVLLSGVQAESPAAKAGLQGGDVIVGVGGKSIENIYDYSYALESLKPGVAIEVAVTREGERRVLSLTPLSRD